jgi:LPS O-antigen subunit length determinant protein (WzzB/FepE family)
MSETESNWLRLLALVWRRRLVIVLITVLGAAASIGIALTRAPTWQSVAVVAPAEGLAEGGSLPDLGQFGALAAALPNLGIARPDVERLSAILQSRSFTESLLIEEGILRELKHDLRPPLIQTGDAPSADSIEYAVERFDTIRTVGIDRKTGFIRLTMRARTPELAQSWLQRMIDRLNATERQRAAKRSQENLAYLRNLLEREVNADLRTSIARLVNAEVRRGMLANASADFAVTTIDPPNLPETKFSPRRKVIVVFGTLGAFLLAVLAVLGHRMFGNLRTVVRQADVA